VREVRKWRLWACCGAVAVHAGMAHRLSTFEGSEGRWILAPITGWRWRIPGTRVALSFPGALSQQPDQVVSCHPYLICWG